MQTRPRFQLETLSMGLPSRSQVAAAVLDLQQL